MCKVLGRVPTSTTTLRSSRALLRASRARRRRARLPTGVAWASFVQGLHTILVHLEAFFFVVVARLSSGGALREPGLA